MANTIDLNISPYYDDFDPTKDFLRVLFRPGYPVQARELNTIQSFLQNQISRHGNFIFKDGSRVTEGATTYDPDVVRLTLTSSGNSVYTPANAKAGAVLSNIESFEGKLITNSTGTVQAVVIRQPTTNNLTSSVGDLYIKYITETTFDSDGGYIYALAADNSDLTFDMYNTYSDFTNAAVAHIEEGVYYIREHFTRIAEQTVVIDATSNIPTKEVGFTVSTTFVTQNDDATLYDIARGSPNEGAPGAHRFKQSVTFTIKDIDEEVSTKFYLIFKIVDGVVQEQANINPLFAELSTELARRTYDESGHYTVSPFSVYTTRVTDSDEKYFINVSKGKAYVAGFEHDIRATVKIKTDKALTVQSVSNHKIPVEGASSIELTSHNGADLPGTTGGNTTAFANRLLLQDSDTNTIGVARAYIYQDEFSKGESRQKLYFYDAKFFQVLTLDSDLNSELTSGNDVYYNDTMGYYYSEGTDVSWLTSNQIALINTTGKFKVNQTVESSVITSTGKIVATNNYDWTDVVTITDTSGTFVGNVQQGTLPVKGQLINNIDSVIESARDAGGPYDNNVTMIEHTGVATGTPNGEWNEDTKNDIDQVDKTLNFRYLHIKNVSGDRSNINYGWLAQDRHIHLGAVDALKVYKITKSNGIFSLGQFERLSIATAGVLPQGAVLKGKESGNEAIVALSNTTLTGLTDLSSGLGYHEVKTGTGDSALVEVVWQKGSRFIANEQLEVTVPSSSSAYTATVTYLSVSSEIGEDYTEMFQLDDGQREEFYDISRLVRKRNRPAPTGTESLVVFFSYYSADPSLLGYYNADSYSNNNFWTEDPRYTIEPQDITSNGLVPSGIELRNCWDFRFRHSGAIVDVTKSPFAFQSRGFYDQPRIKPKTNFTTDYKEYLGRIDVLTLNEKGNLRIIKGDPAKAYNLKAPVVPTRSMHVATIENAPAERYPALSTGIEVIDNKRYTMRDIGTLDKRISRVEEAVSLSILETQALNDNIEDREKVGFIAEDFSAGIEAGFTDADHKEYKASIITNKQELVPGTTSGQPIDMEIVSTTNIDSWFLTSGKRHIVKSYDNAVMIQQLETTGSRKINPFQSWIYQGKVTLTPSKQFWKESVLSYYISLNGNSEPFNEDSDAFWALSRITEPALDGYSKTLRHWTGEPSVKITENKSRTNTRTVTNRSFEKSFSDGIETVSKTNVVPSPSEHMMDPVTIAFTATGLKPNTIHSISFNGSPATDIIGKQRPTFTSSASGEISGTFGIPRNTYNVGDHVFTIASVESPQSSFADVSFNSSGFIQYGNSLLSDESISQSDRNLVTGFWEKTTNRRVTQYFNPVAQTFTLPVESPTDNEQILTDQISAKEQESIITSVDLWFTTVDQRVNMNTVLLQIREVVNGYPAGNDKTLGSAFVTVDRTTYQQTDGSQVITDAKAVNFRFPNPVRLVGGKEYCIVLISPSDQTQVCVAELGQNLVGKNGIHDEQPNVGGYFGSFFVSQNGESWSSEQNIDLTFRVNRADFGKGSETPEASSVTLQNTLTNGFSSNDLYTTGVRPLGFRADIGNYNQGICFETFENSNYVKVYHPNHGLHHDGAQVIIWGIEQTFPNGNAKDYNGIPVSEIDLGVTEDTFQTTTSVHKVYYPTLNSYFIKTTTKATSSGLINSGLKTCATQDIVYDMLISNINSIAFDGTSVTQTIKPSTTCSADLEVLNNKINNASLSVVTADSAYIPIEPNKVTRFSNPKIVRSKANAVSTVDLTSVISLNSTSRWSSPIIPNGRNLDPIAIRCVTGNLLDDSDIEGLTTRTITGSSTDDQLLEYASYVAAVESNQEHSAYISKQIDLEIPANGIDVYFDADMQPGAEIEVFFKAKAVSDETPFGLLEWQPFPQSTNVNSKNYGEFGTDTSFKQYNLHIPVGFDFDSFKVKIRMNCENEAEFPTIKNLRIIGSIVI